MRAWQAFSAVGTFPPCFLLGAPGDASLSHCWRRELDSLGLLASLFALP